MKFTHFLKAIILMLLMPSVAWAANDSIPEVPEFKREIETHTFVPKGQMICGVSCNFSQSKQDNFQFLILENINGDTYSMKVSPMVFYAFKDNMAIGGRIGYKRSRTKVDNADLVLDSETSYSVENFYTIGQTFSAAIAYRHYINIGRQKRFGLFMEVNLEGSGGQSKIMKGQGIDFTGTYSKNFGLSLGFQPGVSFFLSNYSALEIGVGVLGIGFQKTDMVTNQVYQSSVKSSSANFRVNLFSINFGVVFYL